MRGRGCGGENIYYLIRRRPVSTYRWGCTDEKRGISSDGDGAGRERGWNDHRYLVVNAGNS